MNVAPPPPLRRPPYPDSLGSCTFQGSGCVVVDLLFNVAYIVCGSSVILFLLCYAIK